MSKKDLVPRQPAWSIPSFLGDDRVRVWRWFILHKDRTSSSSSSSVFFLFKEEQKGIVSHHLSLHHHQFPGPWVWKQREEPLPLPNAISPNSWFLTWEMFVRMKRYKHLAHSSAPGVFISNSCVKPEAIIPQADASQR